MVPCLEAKQLSFSCYSRVFFFIISRYWIHYLIFYVIGSINWYYINYFIWPTILKKIYRYKKKEKIKLKTQQKTIKIPQFIIFLISLYIFIFLFFFQSALYKITNRLIAVNYTDHYKTFRSILQYRYPVQITHQWKTEGGSRIILISQSFWMRQSLSNSKIW
jgi:hypothetical protein